ncbi:MAG: hypothetical protein GEV10_09970 [Streptosporangiales bacterium]|nr:hypothetical protein [Streptosporangiales bacterium]
MRHEQTAQAVRFTCWHCQYVWVTEYDVRHVEDDHGHGCDYYSLGGVPTVTPTVPGGIACPRCGALRVTVQVDSRPPE